MDFEKRYIYGVGGMASLFFNIAKKNGLDIDGFCIEDEYHDQDQFNQLPLVPFSALKSAAKQRDIDLYIAVGPIKMNQVRQRIYLEAKEAGFNLPNFICDSVFVVDPYTMGEGNIILNTGCIHSGVSIGNNNFLSSTVTLGHGVKLGDGNFFAGGVIVAGESKIEDRCFFGLGVTISDNLVIAQESFVGQGCAITKNTDAKATYTAPQAVKHKFDSTRFCEFIF
ncbi:MAG: hypothetical protein MI867_15010 [Pseudomonadales bacterium]|nr:hypothetical protein [Pseudomonadales bacterium]